MLVYIHGYDALRTIDGEHTIRINSLRNCNQHKFLEKKTLVTHMSDDCSFRSCGHARAAPYFFTFHTNISTMGSKEARNSRKAFLLSVERSEAVEVGAAEGGHSRQSPCDALCWRPAAGLSAAAGDVGVASDAA